MTETEIKEELGWIKKAKKAIYLTGSSYSRSGLQLTRANLKDLRATEKELRAALASLEKTNAFYFDMR